MYLTEMMIELIGRKRRSRGLALKPVPLPIAATTALEMIGRPALSSKVCIGTCRQRYAG
jgi:hypothetical protein